jgi:RHS repeat-associated protein
LSEVRSGSDTGTLIGAAVHDADGHMVKLCEVSTGGTITQPTGDCTATGTGATTLALVWNALDHLNTATRTGANAIAESYQYDDSGRRISKTSAGTTTSYLYDGDAIHAEWNGNISGNPAAAYVHGGNIDQPLLRLTGTTNGPGATQAAYLQDGLGSVVGTANASGTLTANQRFDAWGNKLSSSGAIPQYGYTGREPDQTGLEFYRARYYHPGLGRFASRDPMGMADSASPYAYVANSPTNLIDPMGLEALLSGTPMSAAYWGMLADASFYNPGTATDARGGIGSFTPGSQKLPSTSGLGVVADIGVGFTPAGVVADVYGAATGKTAFGGQELSGWERALGLIPGVSEGMAVFRGGVKGAGAVGDAVKAYDVGPANALKARSLPNDGLQIHHAGQGNPMSQAVPGYQYSTAPAIVLPEKMHREIPTIKGAFTGTARDQLAKDILDLRAYTNAPNSALRELIDLNKSMYPDSFRKP